jgi:hypothetical protein
VAAPRIEWEIRRAETFLSILDMQRLTARLLLLVLFAGTLAPFAAAVSVPDQHEHCARMPQPMRGESTPTCHHQAAGATHESIPPAPASRDSFQPNSCCAGHECCRPLARALWAQVSLHASARTTAQTADRIPAFQPQIRSIELAAYHPVRAPPAL